MNTIAAKQELRAALRNAASRYGQPMISDGAVYFGALRLDGKHEVEFIIGSDKRIVYHRDNGKFSMLDGLSFKNGGKLHEAMAEYAEQFCAPQAPKRDQWNAEWMDALAALDAREEAYTDELNKQYAEEMQDLHDRRALMGGY